MSRKGSTQLPEFTPHAATTPPQEPDLLQRLSFEHRQIERMWAELRLAHRRHVEDVHRPDARYGSTGQRELARQLTQALKEHEAAELEMLYPLAADVVGDAWADHARDDHAEIGDLLDEVDGQSPEDEDVFQMFTQVLAKVLAHLEEEEKIIFPMLRVVAPGGEPLPPAEPVIDLMRAERDLSEAGTTRTERPSRRSPGPRLRLRRR